MNRKFGALPPDQFGWQMGKTAASISFVNDAVYTLTNDPSHKYQDLIIRLISLVKEGTLVIEDWLTVDDAVKKYNGLY